MQIILTVSLTLDTEEYPIPVDGEIANELEQIVTDAFYDIEGIQVQKIQTKRSMASLKIQFEEGQRAFYNGKLKNPYNVNNIRHKEWERGFNSAYFNNKKRRERR